MSGFVMFISQIFNGLKIGSVYALVALGYTMVYGIIRLLNFAHGDFIMIGAYTLMLSIPALAAMGMPAWTAVIPATLVCALVGVLVERLAYKPVREKGNSMTALITAIAMSLLLENGSQAIFGADYKTVPTIVSIPTLTIGQLKIDGATIVSIVLGVVMMVAMQLYVKRRQGSVPAHGHQRERHHHPDLRHRLGACGYRCAHVLRVLPAGLPNDGHDARPESLRGGRARRHRLDSGRYGRRPGDRPD